tara:strand:- start:2591 stop:3517 length:927 start_codon:yes stop_codon:yes gene_type:complete
MPSKTLALVVFFFLLAPALSLAEEEDSEEEKCSITNLGICLPEKFYKFTLSVFNAPVQPFLWMVKGLLTEPVNIESFAWLWTIIVYIISLFYGLFILFAGFYFVIGSNNPEKRELAKEWLKNVVLMVFFVQASFFLYGIIVDIGAGLTESIVGMINEDFFLLTIDNIPNLGFQLGSLIPYVSTLFFTAILLGVRYLVVAAGVVFFPLGLFFNFVPVLRGYGKLIINILMVAIFLPFFQSIILLFGSLLVELTFFANFKILVSTMTFFLIDMLVILLVLFVIVKSAFTVVQSSLGRGITTIATMGKGGK